MRTVVEYFYLLPLQALAFMRVTESHSRRLGDLSDFALSSLAFWIQILAVTSLLAIGLSSSASFVVDLEV